MWNRIKTGVCVFSGDWICLLGFKIKLWGGKKDKN